MINKNYLDDHRIPYTSEELEIHTNFLRSNQVYYESNGFVKLENWLLKLGRSLTKDPGTNQELVHKMIVERWLTICFSARRLDCLLLNRLILRYGFFYLECFYHKAKDRALRRNPDYDF